MDAPCGRCKSWLEYHYMNLDDENKSLLMVMMGDFQNEMVIYIQTCFFKIFIVSGLSRLANTIFSIQ
jgi:hypothetical protein